MSREKREERERFKEALVQKYDNLAALPYPSAEYDRAYKEFQRDYEKLKRLSKEATEEWLLYGD